MATKTPDTQNPDEKEIIQEKELLSWKAPARPFKRRDKKFWVTLATIAILFGSLMFIIDGAMPVILIITIVFFYYVLSTVEPETVTFTITNKGIKIIDSKIPWSELPRYWFTQRFSDKLLIFEKVSFPGRLELVIDTKDETKIRNVLKDYVLEEEIPPSRLDKATNWIAKKIPGY